MCVVASSSITRKRTRRFPDRRCLLLISEILSRQTDRSSQHDRKRLEKNFSLILISNLERLYHTTQVTLPRSSLPTILRKNPHPYEQLLSSAFSAVSATLGVSTRSLLESRFTHVYQTPARNLSSPLVSSVFSAASARFVNS